jgi:hypothetical protein
MTVCRWRGLAWAEVSAPAAVGPLTIGVSERGLALVRFGAGPGARALLAGGGPAVGRRRAEADPGGEAQLGAQFGIVQDGTSGSGDRNEQRQRTAWPVVNYPSVSS